MTHTETERRAIFKASPMLMGFLSTLLEDLQHSEDERECGTIWTVPDVTFNAARRLCDAFYSAAPVEESDCSYEQLGSDLYMEMAGHGVGFANRNDSDLAARLSACVARSSLETYLGDDGEAYICGMEAAI